MGRPLRRGHEHPVLAGTIVGAASAPPSWVGMPRRHLGGCSSAGRAPGCGPGCRGFEPRHSPHPHSPHAPRGGCCRWAGMMGACSSSSPSPSSGSRWVLWRSSRSWSSSSRRPLRIRISDRSTQLTGRRSPLRRRHSPSPSPTTSSPTSPRSTCWDPMATRSPWRHRSRLATPSSRSSLRSPTGSTGSPSVSSAPTPTPSRARRPSPSTPLSSSRPHRAKPPRRPAARQRRET